MKPILGLINHAAAVNDVLIVFRLGKSLSNSRFFHSKQRGEIFSDGVVQWKLDLRKPNLRKNLDLRKIVGATNFLVHKLFDLRKIF